MMMIRVDGDYPPFILLLDLQLLQTDFQKSVFTQQATRYIAQYSQWPLFIFLSR